MPNMTHIQIAENFGESYATTYFEKMQNIENQGKNFTWEKFPELFYNSCKSAFFRNTSIENSGMENLQDIAGQSYMKKVKTLIENAEKEGKLQIQSIG